MIDMFTRKDIITAYERLGSVRAVAKELGIHRQTVSRYVREAQELKGNPDADYTAYLKSDPQYKRGTERPRKAMTEAVCAMIDGFLRENEAKRARGDRKLCMKGQDIHRALLNAGHTVSYPSVTKYILKKRSGVSGDPECFIRQAYAPGVVCEFDWGEFHLTIDSRRMKVYMAVFTLAYSNRRMAFLFFHQDTRAFLESHRLCLDIFSGVPHVMTYDNMRVAVKSFVGGKQPTDALLRLEHAYGFRHRFCNIRSGNEKGHVERSVEVVRRKAFCGKDSFGSLEEANKWLYDKCMDMNMEPLSAATADIVRRGEEDLAALLPLRDSVAAFDLREAKVDKYGTVVLSGAHYSVPDTLVGRKVSIHEYASRIEVYDGRTRVAVHEKTPINGWKLDMMHYLRTFAAKPGSVAGSSALQYAEPEIRELYRDHFADNPTGLINLLELVRDNGLTLEDLHAAHITLEGSGINPAMPGAFEQLLLHEEPPTPTPPPGASADEIEGYAVDTLRQLTQLMDKTPELMDKTPD